MTSRSRLRQDVDIAHDIQTTSGIQGALHGAAIGLGSTIILHYSWPFFRRQTFPFKGFIVCTCSVFGLVLSAERALQEYEAFRRLEENSIRKEARYELAQQGVIPTETAITQWRKSNNKDK